MDLRRTLAKRPESVVSGAVSETSIPNPTTSPRFRSGSLGGRDHYDRGFGLLFDGVSAVHKEKGLL